ncbi:MAG: EamA family transporter [Gammaproteobacteria bacterium]|nr:EamA family transporter [Gammaproteobacteria bacterium]NIM72243.1 EamA family transporter [Gammaproteobacteria bacterium]NIN39158.1 EamA family transporter [Gammaproteobacteria bacterium]NIO23991.1 EamA family transporter [Gammaproteobacteria bacterium]NIO64643.1 EamA family transporter [Gammaproteobacteria bacterium]
MTSSSRAILAVPLPAIAISVLIHTLWGGNPVAVKYSLLVFPPLWTAFFRFLIAIVCVGIWAKLRGVPIVPSRHEWPALLLIGALFTVQIAAMNIGFDLTTGSMGSVLIATNPLFAALFAHFLIAGDRLSVFKAAGLLIAFLGTALVLTRGAGDLALTHGALGNFILLLSACLLGGRLILSARVLQRMDEARVILWQMILSLPLFALGGALFETIQWQAIAWQPVAGLVYQGAIVAGVGFSVSFYLMKRYAPSVIVSFNFVSPIAGVLLSAWLLGEAISAHLWAGMSLVAIGLFLIARR